MCGSGVLRLRCFLTSFKLLSFLLSSSFLIDGGFFTGVDLLLLLALPFEEFFLLDFSGGLDLLFSWLSPKNELIGRSFFVLGSFPFGDLWFSLRLEVFLLSGVFNCVPFDLVREGILLLPWNSY